VSTQTQKITNDPIKNPAATTASGLIYIVTKHGEDVPLKTGDTAIVNYTGLLTNDAKFDTWLDRNETFSFKLSAGMVIKGWDEGIQKWRVGDHATFIIPLDSTLILIVEVVSVK
jgi:FKBP-type peptidyl-prolyl cis-trans isomerase